MNRENIYEIIRTAYRILGSAGFSDDSQALMQGESLIDSFHNPLLYSLYAPKDLIITVDNLKEIWYEISSDFKTDDNIRTWLDVHNDVVLRCTKKIPNKVDDGDEVNEGGGGDEVDDVDRSVRGYLDICKDHSSCCRRWARLDYYTPVIFDDRDVVVSFGDFVQHTLSLIERDLTWITKFYYFKVSFRYYLGTCSRYEFKDEIH